MLISIFFVILLFCSTLSLENTDFTDVNATDYLLKYGYLKTSNNSLIVADVNSEYSDAIIKYQEFFNLETTGILDENTTNLMLKPRCGVADFTEEFSLGKKWISKKVLRWKFLRGTSEDKLNARIAFEMWQRNSGLTFYMDDAHPDILITYSTRNHTFNKNCGGESEKCYSLFDGNGRVLGHTYYPNGNKCIEMHLDSTEKWFKLISDPSPDFISLHNVLVHEIGHSLGIGHSSNKNAVMFPYYTNDKLITRLEYDDIIAIQSLYGPPVREHITTTTTRRTPKPTTKRTHNKTTMKMNSRSPNPHLCEVKSKISRFSIFNDHLYLFYKEWVWIVSLNDKIIPPPVHLLQYIPLPYLEFSNGDGHFYQRPSGEIVLLYNQHYHRIDQNNFAMIERKSYDEIDLPNNANVHGVVNTYRGRTFIFYDNNLCMELDECTLKRKDMKFISKIFPGIPSNISSVFRYTNGLIYFLKDNMIYEFNEFLSKVVRSYPLKMEELFELPCQSEGLLNQLKSLLNMIIAKQIIISEDN